jgi:hypothetical protein
MAVAGDGRPEVRPATSVGSYRKTDLFESALYLRSVCWFNTVLRGLRCHPLTCILLKRRLSTDSIPSALTISPTH